MQVVQTKVKKTLHPNGKTDVHIIAAPINISGSPPQGKKENKKEN
jgi:hypothetical protein